MSFASWLLEHARARGEAIALVDDRGSISHGALYERTRATAAHLRAELPAQARAIVPILGENSIDLVVAYLATLWAGALPALVPPMSRSALDTVLETTEAQLVLGDDERLAQVAPRLRVINVASLATRAAPAVLPEAAPQETIALLLFTSGSTGAPRGVMLSAENLSENTREIMSALSLGDDERTLSSLPIYYCYGTSVVHAHLRAGATVFLAAFRFPEEAVKRIAQERITFLPAVPSLFESLARRSTLGQGAVPNKIMISGGRTAPATLAELRKRLPAARFYMRYGVTELTSAASILAPELLSAKLGSIGRGLPSYPLSVQRADGSATAPGEPGEIVARGPCVTLGYFRDPEASAKVFRDGAFHTGDIARVDEDGYIYVLGRQQEFIKSAGHRISPHEIEDAIATHADVVEVAVCAEPDALRGEMPIALVVLRAGVDDPSPLFAHAGRLLPRFKVPGRFVVVLALPRTASGKLRREALLSLVAPKSGL